MLPRQGPPFFSGRRDMLYRGAPRAFGGPPFAGPPMRRPRGGLLSRLLNRSSRSSRGLPGGMTGFERQAGGMAMPKGASTASFQQILANTQQVLNTVQQAGPLIQQYGPLVKNLPSMWNLYRGLKSLPDADKGEETGATAETKAETEKKAAEKTTAPVAESAHTSEKPEPSVSEKPVRKKQKSKDSQPKLYI